MNKMKYVSCLDNMVKKVFATIQRKIKYNTKTFVTMDMQLYFQRNFNLENLK